MKRYRLLIIGALLVGAGITGNILTSGSADVYVRAKAQMPGGLAFALLGSWLAVLGGAIVLSIGGRRKWRAHQRAHGHYTRAERAAMDLLQRQEAATASAWAEAAALASDIAGQRMPAPLQVWGLVLREGEVAYLDTRAFYSRWYGGDGSYTHVGGLFFGSASFVATGYALTALGNKARRDAARAAAIQRWREHQEVAVLVTSQRIACNVGGHWLSFWLGSASGFYPEPANWSVTLAFPDAVPLRLSGLAAPRIAVLAAWILYGERGLAEHPALAALRPDSLS
jgi:hypothetical protein